MKQLSEKQQEDIEQTAASGDEKEDEDLDGVPLDGAALLKSALMRGIPASTSNESPNLENSNSRLHESSADTDYEDDIDGIPCKIYRMKCPFYIIFTYIFFSFKF